MYYTSPSLSKSYFGHIKDARKKAMAYLKSDKDTVQVYERRRGYQGQVFCVTYRGKRHFGYRSSGGKEYAINKDGTLKR